MREKLPQKLLIKWEVLFAGLALVTAAVWVLAEVFPVFKGSFFMLLFFAAGYCGIRRGFDASVHSTNPDGTTRAD